jgi:hypothetical protein
MELTVFVGEWAEEIPDFELAPGFSPRIVQEQAEKLVSLPLTWKHAMNPAGAACGRRQR